MGRNAATGDSDKVEVHSREEVDQSIEEVKVKTSEMEVDQSVKVANIKVQVDCIKVESDHSSVEVVHSISEVQQSKNKINQNQGGYSEKDLVNEGKDEFNSGKLNKHTNDEDLVMECAKESKCDTVKRAPNKAIETVTDSISKNGKKKGNCRKSVEKQSIKDAANENTAQKIAPSSKVAKTKTQKHNDATSVSSVITNKTANQTSAKEKVKLDAKTNTKIDNKCAINKHREHISGAPAKEYIDTATVADSEIVESIIVDCQAISKLEIDVKSQSELEEETHGQSRSDQKSVTEIVPKIKASCEKSNEKRESSLKKEQSVDKEKVFESVRRIKETASKKIRKQPESRINESVIDKSEVMSSNGNKNVTCDQVVAVNITEHPQERESSHEMNDKSPNNPEDTEEIVQESIDSVAECAMFKDKDLHAKDKPAGSSMKIENETVLKEAEQKIVSIPSENIYYDHTNKCTDARHDEYDIETLESSDIPVPTSRPESMDTLEKTEITESNISVIEVSHLDEFVPEKSKKRNKKKGNSTERDLCEAKKDSISYNESDDGCGITELPNNVQGADLEAVKLKGVVRNDDEGENKVIERPNNEHEDHIDKHTSKSDVKSEGHFEVKSKKKRKKKKSGMDDSVYVEMPEKSLSTDTESNYSGKTFDERSTLISKEIGIRSVSEMPTTSELLTNKPNTSDYKPNKPIVSRLADANVELSDKPIDNVNAVIEPITEVSLSGIDSKQTTGYMVRTSTGAISNKHTSEDAAKLSKSGITNKLSGNTTKSPVISMENNTYRDTDIPSASGIDNKHTFADKAKYSARDVDNKTSEDDALLSASGVANKIHGDVSTALASTVHLKHISVTKEKAVVNDMDNKKTSGKLLTSEIEKEKIEMLLPRVLKDGEKNILRKNQDSGEFPEEEMFVTKKKNRKKKKNEEAKIESSRSSSEIEIVEEKTTPIGGRSICKEMKDIKDCMSKNENEALTMDMSGMKHMYERNVRCHESKRECNIDCDENDTFGNEMVVKSKNENVFLDIGPKTQALAKDDDNEIIMISEEKRMEDSAESGSKYETAESAEDDPATWERSEFEECMEDNETEDDTATASSSNVSCYKRSYELDFAKNIIDTSNAIKSTETAAERDQGVCIEEEDKNDTSETDKTVKEDGIAGKKEVVAGTKVDMGASLIRLSMYDESAGNSSRSSEERDGRIADKSIAGKSENKSKKKKRKNKK